LPSVSAAIAYAVSIYADERHAGIWIMNSDGSGAHRIATADEDCYGPAWASR
jgi:hypothetical protein